MFAAIHASEVESELYPCSGSHIGYNLTQKLNDERIQPLTLLR